MLQALRQVIKPSFWRRNLPRLRSPVWRSRLVMRLLFTVWPWVQRPAELYRRTLLRRVRLTVVVGSLGKTTTTRAVAVALGIPAARVREENEVTFVVLALMAVRPWQRHAVIEVGIARPGQMARYRRMLRPDTVVVTAVASEHLRSFASLDAIRDEKSEMLRDPPPRGLAVLNGDDPRVLWMRGMTGARVMTFGFDASCDVRASDVVSEGADGTTFTLHADGTSVRVRSGLIGRAYVYAALAGVAVARAAGLPRDQVVSALASLRPVRERLSPVRLPSGAVLLRDEFKSTLESVDAALDALFAFPARRRLVILGNVTDCPGRSRDEYRRLGQRIGAGADRAIFLSSDATAFSSGAHAAGMPRENILKLKHEWHLVPTALPADVGPGDVILIKGRGSDRLARISLVLMGRAVRCRITRCPLFESVACDACPLLERGWGTADLS